MMTSLRIIRLSERVGLDSVQQLADSLHGALQRNSSGEASITNLMAREIIVTVFGMGNSADDVIMSYLKFKKLLNDVTIAYCAGVGKREIQQYPKRSGGGSSDKLEKIIRGLQKLHQATPITHSPPSTDDIARMQQALGISFHPDYITFLREASTINYGNIKPLMVREHVGHCSLTTAFHETRELDGFPNTLFPICEDNADYYCMHTNGRSANVIYWSHNGQTDEEWPDIGSWIDEVWIGEAEE